MIDRYDERISKARNLSGVSLCLMFGDSASDR
jgi:hypothetical protein